MSKRAEILDEIIRMESILIEMESDKSSVPENQRSAHSKELMRLYKRRFQLIDAYQGLVD